MGIIIEIGKMIGTTASDYLLLLFIITLFLWYRKALKATVERFEGHILTFTREFTEKIDANAASVKEHLDNYSVNHERNWDNIDNLVKELKEKKVSLTEYKNQLDLVHERYETNRDKIQDLKERFEKMDEHIRYMEQGRRVGDASK